MTSLSVHSQITALQNAGTGQLRQIAKLWKVKGASKLKREALIFSIIGKQQENKRMAQDKEGQQLYIRR